MFKNVLLICVVCAMLLMTVSVANAQQFTRITEGDIVRNGGNSWGSSWGDYDNDGYLDLFVANKDGDNFLYHNEGDNTFTRVTSGHIVNDNRESYSGSWGDYDNDGYLDLFVANEGDNLLYHNEGDGTFNRVISGQIVNDGGTSYGASWGDYNEDGDLDLFVANTSSQNNFLYENNGDGTFTKITTGDIVNDEGSSKGCVWGDYDNDGDLDLFVANTSDQNNFLYQNDGDGTFTKITTGEIVTDGGSSQGANWGDYDNNGFLDLYVINYGPSTGQPNFLYQNNGDGTFDRIITGNIVSDVEASFSSSWVDYDNDGYLDMFVANSGDTPNNSLYHNNGNGTFTKITEGGPVEDSGAFHGCCWGDYDNDGDSDLYIANGGVSDNNNFLYQNNGNGHHWLNVHCTGLTHAGESAIGSKVSVKTTFWQMRQVSGMTGRGGQDSQNAEFGLGAEAVIESLKVEWSNGEINVWTDVTPDQFLTVYESDPHFTHSENILNDGGISTGISWADYDNDNDLDVFVTNLNGEDNVLYRCDGINQFTRITEGDIVNDGGSSYASSWGDYDNDGDVDLFVANNGYNFLYDNNGDGTFTKNTTCIIAIDGGTSYGGSWGDYNNDGHLDLFVANNGYNDLYRNRGDGTFRRITESVVVNEWSYSSSCSWTDMEHDGDLDLFVTNAGDNFLYENNGDGTFTKITRGTIVNDDAFSVGGSWGDINNDGYLDLFVANIGDENMLYRNRGDASFIRLITSDVVDNEGLSYGSSWGDFENDGDLDLMVTNGGFSQSQQNYFYTNYSGNFRRFNDSWIGRMAGQSLGCSWADYNLDGHLDLFVCNNGGNFLHTSNGNSEGHWLIVKCIGTISNYNGIGTKVKVKMEGDDWQIREISGQSGGGYGGQNGLHAEFGLGEMTVIDSLVIEWSSGIVQVQTDVEVDQVLTIVEEYDNTCLPYGVDVIIPQGLSGDAGQTVLIPIVLPCDDVEGSDIIAFQFELSFDETVLNPINYVTEGTLTDGDWTITFNDQLEGRVIVNGFNVSPLETSGTLIKLECDVLSSDHTPLVFDRFMFNEGDPSAMAADGEFNGEGGQMMISGYVQYWSACDGTLPVINTTVALSGDDDQTTTTDEDGYYSFVVAGGNLVSTPTKEGDVNGISTFDAARVAQYSAGLYDFNPCQLAAADVTQNGSVNPFDAARIAQYSAGMDQDSHTGEWIFDPENYEYTPLNGTMTDQNFSAILLGEATGNWQVPTPLHSTQERWNEGKTDASQQVQTTGVEIVTLDPQTILLTTPLTTEIFAFQLIVKSESPITAELPASVPADWKLIVHQKSVDHWFVGGYGISALDQGELVEIGGQGDVNISSGLINETPITTSKMAVETAIPTSYALHANYPNPFNPKTTIQFDLPEVTQVRLQIYNASGKLIKSLIDDQLTAGYHRVEWLGVDEQGQRVNSGVYFYRLETESYQDTKRMILLK